MEKQPFEGNKKRRRCIYCDQLLYWYDDGNNHGWLTVEKLTGGERVFCDLLYRGRYYTRLHKPGIAENDKTFSSEIEFFTRFFVKSIKKKNVEKRINEGGN